MVDDDKKPNPTADDNDDKNNDKQDDDDKSDDGNEGDNSSSDLIDKANEAADRQEAANKKHEELLKKQEKLQADEIVRGKAYAGGDLKKPEKLTDEQYAEALQRGEVNPLKEDGFIK